MDEEQLTNAIYKALVMFNKEQMDNIGEIMETVGDVMVKTISKLEEQD